MFYSGATSASELGKRSPSPAEGRRTAVTIYGRVLEKRECFLVRSFMNFYVGGDSHGFLHV